MNAATAQSFCNNLPVQISLEAITPDRCDGPILFKATSLNGKSIHFIWDYYDDEDFKHYYETSNIENGGITTSYFQYVDQKMFSNEGHYVAVYGKDPCSSDEEDDASEPIFHFFEVKGSGFVREFSTVANTSYLSLSGNIVTTTSQYSVQPDYSALWYYNINGQPSGNFGYYWNMRLAGTVTATNGEKFMIQNNQIAHYYSNGQLAGMYNGPHHWSFNSPDAIVQDPSSGEIYVTDGGRVVRLFATDWFGVGNIQNAVGVAVYSNYIYVTDDNGVQKFNKTTLQFIGTIGNSGGAGQLNGPKDLTIYNGKIYVADAGNNRIAIYNEDGSFSSSFNGTENNRGSAGQLNSPFGVRVSASGEIFVSDQGNNRIQVFSDQVICLKPQSLRKGNDGMGMGENLGMIVSPNPSSENFTLTFKETAIHEIVIYNSTGAEVLRKTVKGSEMNIADPNLTNGLYTIHATSNGIVNKTKVVIAK